ncbi:7852_t:CDS:1, partial [Paraglomus occultum]
KDISRMRDQGYAPELRVEKISGTRGPEKHLGIKKSEDRFSV